MELILVLHNIRSAHNVGSILRTADGLGVAKVVFSGYTPRVDDERELPHLREKLNKQIAKTALGAERSVESYAVDDIMAELWRLKKEGFTIAGLENNLNTKKPILQMKLANFAEISHALLPSEGSTSSPRNHPSKLGCSLGSSALHSRVVLVLGEEVAGIDNSLYEMIDVFLEIPMRGQKESFNVAVATGMAGFCLMNLPE